MQCFKLCLPPGLVLCQSQDFEISQKEIDLHVLTRKVLHPTHSRFTTGGFTEDPGQARANVFDGIGILCDQLVNEGRCECLRQVLCFTFHMRSDLKVDQVVCARNVQFCHYFLKGFDPVLVQLVKLDIFSHFFTLPNLEHGMSSALVKAGVLKHIRVSD